MHKTAALLALLALSMTLARPLAAAPRPTPATLAAQRQTAIAQLRPLINLLRLHDQQALAVEELLLTQGLASKPVAEQLRALRPVLSSAQLTRWQVLAERQLASVR